uniref:ATP synthase subunit O, mitochondrial n=1 Tax=Lactuca sativa TaxID=4236 RepID=A0A9R1VDG1_LACSA|nr:hypothetical protein LSAT_V11C500268650 [Lactuca sativa]
MVILANNRRLRHVDTIAKRFLDFNMAHGRLRHVDTIQPLPAEEEKELKDTLQEILGEGKKVKLEQKSQHNANLSTTFGTVSKFDADSSFYINQIDPSILGGLVVEFSQKVFDMSIKTHAKQMERFL